MDNQFETNTEENLVVRPEIKKSKLKKIFKIISYLGVFFFSILIIFSSQIVISDQKSDSWLDNLPVISQIKHLVESADRDFKGADRDRINILLLGMGGKNHDGGYLTDTIILASLKPSTKEAAMLSIPRDLTIPVENMGWRKINHINAYAEADKEGSGGLAVSQALSDILDIPIDYYIRADFEGFVNIVNEIGGIKVYVDNTINDTSYPVKGMEEADNYNARYEHLYIEKGWQEMDGDLALKYARSRHTPGLEGSDFARAKRQQKVIQAAKEKFVSSNTFFKPRMITNVMEELHDHIKTNLQVWEMAKLWSEFKDIDGENVTSKVLDNSPEGLLVNMITSEGAYILTPRGGDFAEIQYMVNNIFSDVPVQTKEKVLTEKSSVEVRNGTWINGLANRVSLDLEKYGFDVINVGNASRQNFQKSVIYDLTYGEKLESLSILKEKTDANISFGLPEWLIQDLSQELDGKENVKQPDFILILGTDADNTASGTENK